MLQESARFISGFVRSLVDCGKLIFAFCELFDDFMDFFDNNELEIFGVGNFGRFNGALNDDFVKFVVSVSDFVLLVEI